MEMDNKDAITRQPRSVHTATESAAVLVDDVEVDHGYRYCYTMSTMVVDTDLIKAFFDRCTYDFVVAMLLIFAPMKT
jgi:hypothetical protein